MHVPPPRELLELLQNEAKRAAPPMQPPGVTPPSLLAKTPPPGNGQPLAAPLKLAPRNHVAPSSFTQLAQRLGPSLGRAGHVVLGLLALAGIAALALAGTGISGCASGVPGAHASPTSAGGGFSLSGAIVCSLAFAIAIALRRKKRKPREVLDSRPPPRPRVASPAPHVVAHSIPGLVRERNEDRVLVGRVRDIDLVVVADGMGGHARGEDAADIATSFAMLTALRRLAELPTSEAHAVRAVLLETIWHAAGELARAARGGERDALRCTLILVAVTKSAVVAAWIGDGAVSLVRATGAVVELLEPHRTPEGRQNLLHSSLGPITDGRPSWCIATREPGDVLAVMTDGVADHRDASFADDLARIARSRSSERALVRWLDALAHERDPNGTILREDNLTIAIHSGG